MNGDGWVINSLRWEPEHISEQWIRLKASSPEAAAEKANAILKAISAIVGG